MKEYNIRYGFEPNGGAIFSEIMLTRDGGTTTIKLLNILKNYNKKLGQLISELPKFYSFKDKIDYEWKLQDKILLEARKTFKSKNVDDRDGIKIWLDRSSWILFRSSQNAPEFRVFAESISQKKAKQLLSDGIKLVKRIINENS